MRSSWLDGERARAVEVTSVGERGFRVTVDGVPLELEAESLGAGAYRLVHEGTAIPVRVTAVGTRRFVRIGTLDFVLDRTAAAPTARARARTGGGLESPMPGLVTRVMVQPGDAVNKGQPLLAIEAMKMEHLVRAPRKGKVRGVRARAGEMVNPGVELVQLEEEP